VEWRIEQELLVFDPTIPGFPQFCQRSLARRRQNGLLIGATGERQNKSK
jgi:hypothetical protein